MLASTINSKIKNKKTFEKEANQIHHQQHYNSLVSNLTRGRSILCGTAFGGITEISIRADANEHLWVMLSEMEVCDLIYQLAACIGCEVDVKPRNHFLNNRPWGQTNNQDEKGKADEQIVAT